MNTNIHQSLFTARDFVAGFCAGVSQIAVGQPLDLAKTYIQMAGRKVSITEVCKQLWK
jgi:hypothetical protein